MLKLDTFPTQFKLDTDGYTENCCSHCGGEEILTNPEYLSWETIVEFRLPDCVANDSRRNGTAAQQQQWDAENGAPPRYRPCPICHSLKTMPEAARIAWRQGIAPQISVEGLMALREALLSDDKRLIQGN